VGPDHQRKHSRRLLHRPIASAIRKRDPVAARKAVLQDINQAHTSTFGNLPFAAATEPAQPAADFKR
jgi:DNA-binding GntR family transcriptional regulator